MIDLPSCPMCGHPGQVDETGKTFVCPFHPGAHFSAIDEWPVHPEHDDERGSRPA